MHECLLPPQKQNDMNVNIFLSRRAQELLEKYKHIVQKAFIYIPAQINNKIV